MDDATRGVKLVELIKSASEVHILSASEGERHLEALDREMRTIVPDFLNPISCDKRSRMSKLFVSRQQLTDDFSVPSPFLWQPPSTHYGAEKLAAVAMLNLYERDCARPLAPHDLATQLIDSLGPDAGQASCAVALVGALAHLFGFVFRLKTVLLDAHTPATTQRTLLFTLLATNGPLVYIDPTGERPVHYWEPLPVLLRRDFQIYRTNINPMKLALALLGHVRVFCVQLFSDPSFIITLIRDFDSANISSHAVAPLATVLRRLPRLFPPEYRHRFFHRLAHMYAKTGTNNSQVSLLLSAMLSSVSDEYRRIFSSACDVRDAIIDRDARDVLSLPLHSAIFSGPSEKAIVSVAHAQPHLLLNHRFFLPPIHKAITDSRLFQSGRPLEWFSPDSKPSESPDALICHPDSEFWPILGCLLSYVESLSASSSSTPTASSSAATSFDECASSPPSYDAFLDVQLPAFVKFALKYVEHLGDSPESFLLPLFDRLFSFLLRVYDSSVVSVTLRTSIRTACVSYVDHDWLVSAMRQTMTFLRNRMTTHLTAGPNVTFASICTYGRLTLMLPPLKPSVRKDEPKVTLTNQSLVVVWTNTLTTLLSPSARPFRPCSAYFPALRSTVAVLARIYALPPSLSHLKANEHQRVANTLTSLARSDSMFDLRLLLSAAPPPLPSHFIAW